MVDGLSALIRAGFSLLNRCPRHDFSGQPRSTLPIPFQVAMITTGLSGCPNALFVLAAVSTERLHPFPN